MGRKRPSRKRVLIGVALGAIGCWLIYDRERVVWVTEVPPYLCGDWQLLDAAQHELNRLRRISFEPGTITLLTRDSLGELSRRGHAILRVSLSVRRDPEVGRAVVFYGTSDPLFIQERRLEICYGRTGLIDVRSIVPTGIDNEDHWFSEGRFARVMKE